MIDTAKILLMLGSLGTLCVLTEAATQVLKMVLKELVAGDKSQVLALLVSLLLAVFLVNPQTGSFAMDAALKILAGVLASRGSNYVHDTATLLSGYAKVAKLKGTVADEVKAEGQ